MNQYVKQYQKASIESASKEQILIMLYDAAIQFLNKAIQAMREKNIEAANNNIISAENIIQEFINTLDRDVAPQLADNLTSLYDYFLRRLVYANIKHKIEPINEVLGYLKSLKQTWEKAIVLAKKEENSSLSASTYSGDKYDSDDEDDDDLNDDEDEDEDDFDDEDEE